ncbi:unnamed protein product [Nesidiocoris tenuis]|uniref:Uncharacterized protein n=1 Tax=Nesidiocoris tenuis TaxID=355587 RepID=A0A6H5HP57_9HEMI|nr:unnamed protein product [Nesidiocoris tenuis]
MSFTHFLGGSSSQKFIPLRSSINSEKFLLLPVQKSPKTRKSPRSAVDKEDTDVYSSLLRYEIVPVNGEQDENKSPMLFRYTPPVRAEASSSISSRNIESLSPYTLSAVSPHSQALLRCNRRTPIKISRHVEIWDPSATKQVSKLSGHAARVGTLAWCGDVLASGSRDRSILLRDLRVPQTEFERRFSAHRQEVCGLKWSPDLQSLASGGNDNKLHIWNMHSSSPVNTFGDHVAAVKAIAWSPQHHGLLASGGGTADRTIRFWNTITGQAVQVVDTGSQVCNLAWSKHSSELVSSHGYSQNQIIVWKMVGGGGESHANVAEGLAAALQCLDDLAQRRDTSAHCQKHCILICNSPPYLMPVMENQSYTGNTSEQMASILSEKGINLSILSPRKIPALYKLFEKSGGDLSACQTKNYAKDPRNLVLLKGFSLKERPVSPTTTAPPAAPPHMALGMPSPLQSHGSPMAPAPQPQPQQPVQPQQPIMTNREYRTIWQGLIEWIDKKSPSDSQKTTRHVPCQVSMGTKDGEPELKADTWPQKLIMQLMPKQLIGSIGGQYLKNSKSVLFHLQPSEALEALTKVMSNGFAGCVHFNSMASACDIKVLILLYTAERSAFLGFIPNDQAAFVDRLRRVIQHSKSTNAMNRQGQSGQGGQQMQPGAPQPNQQPGMSGMLQNSMNPQQGQQMGKVSEEFPVQFLRSK